VIAAIVVILVFILIWTDNMVGPMVSEYARSQVHKLASQIINDAVSDYVSSHGIQYSDLIRFEKDSDGNIAAMIPDMSQINALKSSIIRTVNAKLTDMQTTVIRIPLGSALDGELLSGRGPRIPIRLAPYGSADISMLYPFTSAGINQTRYQIIMNVTVDIGVLLPGSTAKEPVSVQICVAETVIVGRVPDSYTHFDDSELLKQGKEIESLVP